MTFSIETLCIECHYAECRVSFVVMLNGIMPSVVMLSVVLLNVVMLNVIMLSVILLNVIMLSVVMLNVMAPSIQLTSEILLGAFKWHPVQSCTVGQVVNRVGLDLFLQGIHLPGHSQARIQGGTHHPQ